MKRTGEFFWVGLLIFVAAASSVSQTILYALRRPEGTVYPLVHNYPEDFYYYLHLMRQGWEGAWTATSRLTPEVFEGVFVNGWFLLLGHAARVTGISLPLMYTLTRVAGAVALLVLSYLLILLVYPQNYKKRFVALLFVLFGSYWWGWNRNGPTVAPLVHQWTELDPLFRLSFIPHHLWSKVFMVAAYILIVYRLFPFTVFLLPFIVVVMGFTNPVVYVTFIPTVALYALLSLPGANRRSNLIRSLLAIAPAAPVLLYHRYLQMNIFPWTSYRLWEQTLQYAVKPWDYAVSLGPTLPLFFLAIPAMWRMGKIGKLLIAWAASSWVMMYIAGPFLSVTVERFLGGYQFIPLGIGATVWVFTHKRFNLLWVALLVYFSVGLYASFKEHAGYVAENRNNSQIYVPRELMDAFGVMEKNSSVDDVVAAPYTISTMIPAFTGRRVVAGHQLMTKDIGQKVSELDRFFAFNDSAFAQDFLARYRVRHVLIPKNNIPGSEVLSNLHLRLIKEYPSYSLYQNYE